MTRPGPTVVATVLVVVVVVVVASGVAGCGSAGSSSTVRAGSATGSQTTTGSTSGVGHRGLAQGHLSVTPASGGPRTRFGLRFTAPASSGQRGAYRVGFTIALTGGAGGCIGSRSVPVVPVQKGATVSIPLEPTALGGRWCPGAHRALVVEFEGPVCRPGMMCPQFLRLLGSVGEATFTVSP